MDQGKKVKAIVNVRRLWGGQKEALMESERWDVFQCIEIGVIDTLVVLVPHPFASDIASDKVAAGPALHVNDGGAVGLLDTIVETLYQIAFVSRDPQAVVATKSFQVENSHVLKLAFGKKRHTGGGRKSHATPTVFALCTAGKAAFMAAASGL